MERRIINVLFMLLAGISCLNAQERTEISWYRYINPYSKNDFIVTYLITTNQGKIKYTNKSTDINNNIFQCNTSELISVNGKVARIKQSFSQYNNNNIISKGSFEINYESSKPEIFIAYGEKSRKIEYPFKTILVPRMLHDSPCQLYFASMLNPEMLGKQGIIVGPDYKKLNIHTLKYRIANVKKSKYKIGDKEYDCDVYLITIIRDPIPGVIRRSADPTEKFYVSNGKLIAYESGGIKLLLMKWQLERYLIALFRRY